jgi:arginase family enzyme
MAERDISTLSIGGEHTCTYPVLKALSKDGKANPTR